MSNNVLDLAGDCGVIHKRRRLHEEIATSASPRCDDDVVCTGWKGVVAGIHFAHLRRDCLVVQTPWSDRSSHNNICGNCFCYVCDEKASACPKWQTHCHAHPDNGQWEGMRKAYKKVALLNACLKEGAQSLAAQDAARALRNMANDNVANKDAIREAGGVAPLVELLKAGAQSKAAEYAAGALCNMAIGNAANKDAIREAGGVAPLVELLKAGAQSKAAEHAAGALQPNMTCNNAANRDAICMAGGVAPLVELLKAGAWSVVAKFSAAILADLATNNERRSRIRRAGAVEPLLALVRGGSRSKIADDAATTVARLANQRS